MLFYHIQVMKAIVDDSVFIKKLLEELKSSKIPMEEKADLVCSFYKLISD